MAALLPVEDALALLLVDASPLAGEDVPLGSASNRVLAVDIHARRTQPPFDASAMDGYAVRADDVAQIPARLRVIGVSVAGQRFSGCVNSGEAVRIFTGAPVPAGADAILLQEDARLIDEGTIEALEAVARGRHIRRAGLDFSTGDLILPSGRVLDAAALSLAASANYPTLSVVRKPLVAILATGSELVEPGTTPGDDQIVASNNVGVATFVSAAGGRVVDLGIIPDDRAALAGAVNSARELGADVIVTLGGASVGDHDLVQEVLGAQGMALDFWKIKMRPGKPLISGRLGATRVLGLPGNPVSSFVCSHLFLVPLVARLAGRVHKPDLRTAVLGVSMKANDHRQDHVRAVVTFDEGRLTAMPFAVQDSSMLSTLAEANALIIRAPEAPAASAGDACTVLMLR